jgi:hypothetical protein
MKKILYTVCSANHLAHCKTMADSFIEFNSGYTVIIGLVDKINNRFDKKDFLPHELIEVDQMQIPGFDEMSASYNVIELNCAMKVFVAQYIFQKHDPDILLYLDSDIWVRHGLEEIENALQQNDILITPHFNTAFPDNTALPLERDLLRSGVYNAGFMAFKKGAITTRFLEWWATHMRTECYYNFGEGMGVDQIWLNLVPVLFDKVGIVTNKGANVAYWNLHERKLNNRDGITMVNDEAPLLFLHISGYRFDQPDILSRHQNRYQLSEFPLLAELLTQYRILVEKNGYSIYSAMPCYFSRPVKKSTGLMKTVNQLLKPLGVKISNV